MDLVNSLSGSKKSKENQGSEGSNESFFSTLKDSRLYKNLTNRNNASTESGPKENTQEINLESLDVIGVEHSDSNEEFVSLSMTQIPEIQKLPIFDYLPDEVVLNIFERLSEEGVARLSMVNKRFCEIGNTESIWSKKAEGWVNINVSPPKEGETAIRKYYADAYVKNTNLERQKKNAAVKRKRDQKISSGLKWFKKISKLIWFGRPQMEIPCVLCVMLWTILLCLRADDTIYINYHIVNLPIYVGCFHFFVGLVVTDIWGYLIENGTGGGGVNFKVRCLMTLLVEEFVPIWKRRKYTLYVLVATVVIFTIMLGEYLNEDGILPESGYVWLPFGLLFIYWFVLTLTWRFGREDGYFALLLTGTPILILITTIVVQWLRAVDYVDYSWWTAQVIWWILFAPAIALLFCGTILAVYLWFDSGFNDDTLICCFLLALGYGVSFPLLAQFILYCFNFENLIRDLPTWPWIVTFIPTIFLEGLLVAALIAFDVWYKYLK